GGERARHGAGGVEGIDFSEAKAFRRVRRHAAIHRRQRGPHGHGGREQRKKRPSEGDQRLVRKRRRDSNQREGESIQRWNKEGDEEGPSTNGQLQGRIPASGIRGGGNPPVQHPSSQG